MNRAFVNYTSSAGEPMAVMTVRHDPDGLWTECPLCPGWSATAPTWAKLLTLVTEYHADRHGWQLLDDNPRRAVWS